MIHYLIYAILGLMAWGAFALDSYLVTRPPNKHDLWEKPTEEEENDIVHGTWPYEKE